MPEKQNHYNQQAYEAARDIFDRYKEKTNLSNDQRKLMKRALDRLIFNEHDPLIKNMWRYNQAEYCVEDKDYQKALKLLDDIVKNGGLAGTDEMRDYITQCLSDEQAEPSTPQEAESSAAEKDAWAIYREYLNDDSPDEESVFMAEEALDYLIRHTHDEFNRNVARYNLASLFNRTHEFEQAVRLLRTIEQNGDLPLSSELLAEIYLFADEGTQDEEKAFEILENLPQGLNRNLLLFHALQRSQDGLDLKKAIDLIGPVLQKAKENRLQHPLWAAETQLYAAQIDYLGYQDIREARQSLEAARELAQLIPEKEKKTPRAEHLLEEIDVLADQLENFQSALLAE